MELFDLERPPLPSETNRPSAFKLLFPSVEIVLAMEIAASSFRMVPKAMMVVPPAGVKSSLKLSSNSGVLSPLTMI
jgi:hypothetical protein